MKQLTAHVIDGHNLAIRPAPLERDWMDAAPGRFPYRCLPLNIANAHGWEILVPAGFSAVWDGSDAPDGVIVTGHGDRQAPALGHFGSGILTFHVPCIFQTEPGVDLYVTGPINRPRDGIAPLTGIVETDWSPYTFTMNWQFTRPGTWVRFEEGEPFCHIFPVMRGALGGVAPRLARLSQAPGLEAEHRAWSASRLEFNAELADPESRARQDQWQKSYFRGVTPSGAPAPESHASRLRLRPFTED